MTRLLSSLAARARRGSAGSHYGRAYIFLVVALTIFLLGLACWREPVTGYTARVALVRREGGLRSNVASAKRQAVNESQLRDEICSPQAWNALVEALRLSGSADELAALQQRTTVHVHAKPTGEVHIALWHAGASEQQAKAVAQQLAEHFAQRHSQQYENRQRCEQCDIAQAEVAQAAAAVDQAKAAVESYRVQHAAELSPAVKPSVEPTAGDAQPVVTETPNPLWREISDRLDVLRAAHAQLLQQRTAEHPGVVDLAWQIEAAQSQLTKTPRTISTTATPVVESPLAPSSTTNATVTAPSPEVIDQLRKLTAVADAAERRHREAIAAERRAWQVRWSQPSEQLVIVEPARIVQRHGGGPSKSGILIVALCALAIGAATAWRSQLVERPAAIVSAAQVERLGLPVAAVLATRDGPTIPQSHLSNPPWIRYFTLGCEMALAMIILLLAMVVLADWQVAAQAIWDPLTAFSDALWRLAP